MIKYKVFSYLSINGVDVTSLRETKQNNDGEKERNDNWIILSKSDIQPWVKKCRVLPFEKRSVKKG